MTIDAKQTLIGLLEGMQSLRWQPPSDTRIRHLLVQLRGGSSNEKLVRNGPGHRILAEGGIVRVADEHEMPFLLAHKLVEEAQEVLATIQRPGGSHADIVEELADVTEVIRGLRRVANVRKDDIRSARRAKRMREGDFDERLVWERE